MQTCAFAQHGESHFELCRRDNAAAARLLGLGHRGVSWCIMSISRCAEPVHQLEGFWEVLHQLLQQLLSADARRTYIYHPHVLQCCSMTLKFKAQGKV